MPYPRNPSLTLPLSLTHPHQTLLLSVIPPSTRQHYTTYHPMDDYFLGHGTLPESPHLLTSTTTPTTPTLHTKKPLKTTKYHSNVDNYIYEDDEEDCEEECRVEEKEGVAVGLLLRFLKLDEEAEELGEGVRRREVVVELRRELGVWIGQVEGELTRLREEFEGIVEDVRWRCVAERGFGDWGMRRSFGGRRRSLGGNRRFSLGRLSVKEIGEDRRCKDIRREIRKLDKERRNLVAARVECEKKISYLATADPGVNLQERFDVLEILFSKHKRYSGGDFGNGSVGGSSGRVRSEDCFAYDSGSSSSELEVILDRPDPKCFDVQVNNDDDEVQVSVFVQAGRLLSQIRKLLRDTSVASTNFQLAKEAFEAALWQLKRIPVARMFDASCCDDHLFNSRIDTVKRYFVRAKQFVVKALRFGGGAELVLDSMPDEQFEDLFNVHKISIDSKAGLKRSVHRMKVVVSEALGAVQEAASDLDLFVRDAEVDRKQLTKALIMEQERVVEYRTALIYEHVLRSGTLAKRIVEHPTSRVNDPTGKSKDKRTSHRAIQLQSFDE